MRLYCIQLWLCQICSKCKAFDCCKLVCYHCCAASVASEQQHKQDLRRNIKGSTNSRIHHFLPECIAAFYQNALRLFTRMHCGFLPNALRLLPNCIAPRLLLTTNNTRLWHRCASVLFRVDCSWERLVVMVCFNLPVKTVKRCERYRAWLSQPLLLSLMQNYLNGSINCHTII